MNASIGAFGVSVNGHVGITYGSGYSVSVTRKAGPIPYAIAYVELDEGPRMLTNIVDCDLDTVHIGQRVKVCFKPMEGGQQLPMFTPL